MPMKFKSIPIEESENLAFCTGNLFKIMQNLTGSKGIN